MSASAAQLLRLLRLIPLAAREGGLVTRDAAAMCGVTERDIEKDFRLLTERTWYLPPGRTDDFQILFEGDRILIDAPPAFDRPVRLVLDELLACALALRCAGLDHERRAELCAELEAALARQADAGVITEGGDGAGEEVEFVLRRAESDDIHATLSRGVVHRRRVRFGYVKDGAESPEIRTVEPWRVIHAEGESYLSGHDTDRDGQRLFRVDRILGVEVTAAECTTPIPEGREEILPDGTVQLVVGEREERWAEVRYAPAIARWVRERYSGEDGEDGSYMVRHRLLAEDWIVRHVLAHGADAEVVSPVEVRRAVVEAVGGSIRSEV